MKGQKILSNQEMALFCEQMAMILKAGMTPATGIDLMLSDAESIERKDLLQAISRQCEAGESFHKALENSNAFPRYALDMIRIGNISGKLDEVMDALSFHYNREETIRENIKNAVTYPILILCMMVIIVLVLIIKVLPIFRQAFVQLGSDLTGFSRGLLQFGNTLRNYSFLFIAVLFLLLIAYIIFSGTSYGRSKLASFCSGFFLTKGFFNKIACGRFASGMAITMAAGLDTEESLDLAEKLISTPAMLSRIQKCRKLMEGDAEHMGLSFSQTVVEAGIFNNVYSKMLQIGFTTGCAEDIFRKIADRYDNEVEAQMNRTISVLEPTLVIILSIVVCLILLSVIMPLLGIMSGIG